VKFQLFSLGTCSEPFFVYEKDPRRDETLDVFTRTVPHQQLIKIYQNARVHLCPSWYETPGLASLEAGAAGCNIIVTDRGSTREYFGPHAFYCQPDSVSSIREAVLKAYHVPKTKQLQELILQNYTWAKAAEQTAKAYEVILQQ